MFAMSTSPAFDSSVLTGSAPRLGHSDTQSGHQDGFQPVAARFGDTICGRSSFVIRRAPSRLTLYEYALAREIETHDVLSKEVRPDKAVHARRLREYERSKFQRSEVDIIQPEEFGAYGIAHDLCPHLVDTCLTDGREGKPRIPH